MTTTGTATASTIFIIKPRDESGITAKPRLVRAARKSAAERHLIDAFVVEKASVEEAVALGAEGVQIEDAAE